MMTTQFDLVSDFILGSEHISSSLKEYWAQALARLKEGLPMERAFEVGSSNGRKRRDELIRLYADSLPSNSDWKKAGIIANEISKIKSKRGGSPILKEAGQHYRLPDSRMQIRRIIESNNIS